MIYALTGQNISRDERREFAHAVKAYQSDVLIWDPRFVHVCDAEPGRGYYFCLYCGYGVHLHGRDSIRKCFHHDRGGPNDCVGSDQYLGITNPVSISATCPT